MAVTLSEAMSAASRSLPVQKRCGRDAHGGAVAVASVGPGYVDVNPLAEESAVTAPLIAAAPLLHGSRGGKVVQQNIGYCSGAHCIVRELAAIVEEVEILGFDSVPFVDGTDDVADDCA